MTLLSLEKIVGCEGYYIDDKTLQIWSFRNSCGQLDNEPHLLKGHYNKDGYINYNFRVNGKLKNILHHTIIVKMFIKTDYDYKKEQIDHLDHNRSNNSIDNLAVVSASENCRNVSRSRTGKDFNFVDSIGNSLVINEEAKIYYSLEYDKFFMFINHTNKYKELHELIDRGYHYVKYIYNNKNHRISTTKFRNNLNKK